MWNVVKNLNHEILKTFKNNWQLIFLETTRCLCKEVKNENKILCDMLRVPIFKQQFNKKCQRTQLQERISCRLTEAVSQTNTLWFATVKVRRMSSIQEGRPSTIQLPNLMVWQKDFKKESLAPCCYFVTFLLKISHPKLWCHELVSFNQHASKNPCGPIRLSVKPNLDFLRHIVTTVATERRSRKTY